MKRILLIVALLPFVLVGCRKDNIISTTETGTEPTTITTTETISMPGTPAVSISQPPIMGGMLGVYGKNKLGAKILNNVYIYNGPDHPHEAQQPKVIDINKLK